MEAGVSYNKEKLHQRGYFHQLVTRNEEIGESLRPLLRLTRENIVRLRRTEAALVRSLKRDPLLTERVKRLLSIPAVGPITALTWVLELRDVKRFPSVKQVISYCGLCGAEDNSAGVAKRTPISKQRNRHLQTVLVEAAKLAPRLNPDLALVYEKEIQKNNHNRATLAVARKLVAYLLAVDRRERTFVRNQHDSGAAT
jgi:transposase